MARQDHVNEARSGRTAKFVSKRRRKTLSRFNALQGRIVRRRNDWIEKTTTRLAQKNILIAMEDLDVKAMTRRPKPKPDPAKPGQYLHNGAKAKAESPKDGLASTGVAVAVVAVAVVVLAAGAIALAILGKRK